MGFWKNLKYEREQDNRKKSGTARPATFPGGTSHQFIQRNGPVGTFIGTCSCGWVSDQEEHVQFYAERDWECHLNEATANEHQEFEAKKLALQESLRKLQYDKDTAEFRAQFEQIRRRYVR